LYKFEDITGKTYGERTVVGLSHQHPKSGNYYWKVVCSCGRESVISGTRVKKGAKCNSCSGRINGRKGLDKQAENLPCYFIRCGDYVKIGSSEDPVRRLKDMLSSNPYELVLLHIDYEKGEKYWHDKFKWCHYRGEWYYFSGVCEIVDLT